MFEFVEERIPSRAAPGRAPGICEKSARCLRPISDPEEHRISENAGSSRTNRLREQYSIFGIRELENEGGNRRDFMVITGLRWARKMQI